jgi:hypothetical protein
VGKNHYAALPYDAEAAVRPDWTWLPNALVDGAEGDLAAPVELVRQTQSAAALRLLVDLYHAQNLASDGGIHWRCVRQEFTRHEVGRRGPFVVYGFAPGTVSAFGDKPLVRAHMTGEVEVAPGSDRPRDRGWPAFWAAWNQLVALGLVALVAHVVEADAEEAEVVHPYALGDSGEAPERRLARAAHAAAGALLTPAQRQWAVERGLCLVPVKAHVTEAQLVGVARLRYRPRTSATAAWFARMGEWDAMAARHEALARQAAGGAPASVQHQGSSS